MLSDLGTEPTLVYVRMSLNPLYHVRKDIQYTNQEGADKKA